MSIPRIWLPDSVLEHAQKTFEKGVVIRWKKRPDIILFSDCATNRHKSEISHTQFIDKRWPAGHVVVVVGNCCGSLHQRSRDAMQKMRSDINWIFPDNAPDLCNGVEVSPDDMSIILENADLIETVED
ncbi:hypothetical protein JXR01_03490 [Candidatus Kaiserbacteria bacterium]|nr:MAG: hypothetical protein JXR01_03490 [Candidatus Kaiserbacteria bacterium]